MKSILKIILIIALSEVGILKYCFAQGIEITSGGSLVQLGNSTIEISNGGFVNDGTYSMDVGTFSFSGTTLGTISGSGNNDFYNLIVNNSNGVTHSSSGYIAINNELTFSLGLFNTGSNYLFINDNAIVIGASTSKYINGNCSKVGNDAFIFPLGNTGKFAPIGISAPGVVTDIFIASYFKQSPDASYSIGSLDVDLHNVSSVEYWLLNRTNGASNVNVTLNWDSTSGVENPTDLRVAKWDGAKWINQGNSGFLGDNSSGSVSSDLVTSFNPFTFGSINGTNPLPVELINFNALCDNDKTKLIWSTASEINNNYFEVERSNNNENWQSIGMVNGNGNSNQILNYSFIDEISNTITSYYRLKQIDFDGNYKYSPVVSSNCSESKQIELYISSNPTTDFVKINTNRLNTDLSFQLYDINGKLLQNKKVENNETYVDLRNLSFGAYYLKIIDNTNWVRVFKVVKY
jgi:hypothetical protein